MVRIMFGCDKFCSYCIVPSVRGPEQNRPPEEIEAAHEEGITFHFLNAPVRVLGSDRVTALEIQQQKLSEFDASGRRRPIPPGAPSP